MFVKIDNVDMDVFKVEEWINTNRDANGGVISPKFAMEILVKTNFYGNIKKVINHIKKNCLDENGELVKDKVLAYKDFILSCVDGREMSQQALEVLQDLSDACGIREEFDEINDKEPKEYDKNECYRVMVKTEEELKALEGEDLRIFFDADKVDLYHCDLDKVKKIKFREGACVELGWPTNMPKDLDVSMCSSVDLYGCNLEGLHLKFREGAEVRLNYVSGLPKDLDVSMCSKVNLSDCNLEGLELKFREGAKIILNRATNLPKDLDVSMCSEVNLGGCNLEGLDLKFREGAEVYLSDVESLPKDLDVSMCSKVDLSGCNLEGLELKFREGAEVLLHGAYNLPKDLDVSMCYKVDSGYCNLSGVEKITFRDKAQEDKFMKRARNFSGKVEYDNMFTHIRDMFGRAKD